MSKCSPIRSRFSAYLDGDLTGVSMQQVAAHLESCEKCALEFHRLRSAQQLLSDLGPATPPADLALKLRVAVSQQQSHTPRQNLARWQMIWSNTVAPLALQASAGFASAILLVGTVALLVGAVAAPVQASARDDRSLGDASDPHFLYSNLDATPGQVNVHENPLLVKAYIDGSGRAYDYSILSGPSDAATRARIENQLLFSIFEPARFFGQPVRGVVVLSFDGVSVRG